MELCASIQVQCWLIRQRDAPEIRPVASAKKLAGMQKMKHTLIISFDLIRQGELNQSYRDWLLLAFAKQDKTYGEDFIIHNISINSFDTG
ncbi:MAG: hypothetical protein R2784_21435 [Saprospiraceae bacterium]